MTAEQKAIRSFNIALKCLYRSCGGSIEFSAPKDDQVYDAIAKVENFVFAIVIKSSTFITSKTFSMFLQEVKETSDITPIPLLLVCVNEVQEYVLCASMFNYNVDKLQINNSPKLIALTESNWPNIIDSLKSTDSMIRLLSSKNQLVEKTIVFSKTIQNKTSKFSLTYFRNFDSQCYRMKDPPINLTKEQKFERDCNGVPEYEYPSDTLDELIFSAIQNQFDKAFVKSSLFISSSQYGITKTVWNNQKKAECELCLKLEKDITTSKIIESFPEMSSIKFSFRVNVIADQLSMSISDKILHFDYDIKIKEWIDCYSLIKGKLGTIHFMDEIVG